MSVTLVVIIAAVLITCLLTLKCTYAVERSRTLNVPASKVFALIRDLEAWSKLNPWFVHEPEAELAYSDVTTEVGSYYSWVGTLVGAGVLEHTEIIPDTYIKQKLTFTKPMRATSICTWHLEDHNGKCTLTWGMQGKMSLLFSFIIPSMKKELEFDFDFGLDILAMHLDPKEEQYSFHFKGVHDCPSFYFVYKEYHGSLSGVREFTGKAFPELSEALKLASVKPTGTPFTLTWQHSESTMHIGVAFPVEKDSSTMLATGYVASTKTLKLIFKGDYKHLPSAWIRMISQAKMMKLKTNIGKQTPALEIYETYNASKPNENITALYLPVK